MSSTKEFQHLFFLMEVATFYTHSKLMKWDWFQHLFFLMEVAMNTETERL